MTTMAQFSQALKEGEFPVSWSNNFANYGLPLPLFAHQLPAYLGALLIIAGFSVTTSYNILMFLGVLVGNLLYFYFLRRYFTSIHSLFATVIMNFFPYRIINVYIRGGLPEILASAIFPLLLISIYKINVERRVSGLFLLALSVLLLSLCHPMMLIIYSFPSLLYYLSTINKKNFSKKLIITILFAFVGVGISLYYLMPLMMEMKYFYHGLDKAPIKLSHFLGINNFINPNWYYYLTHPGPRGNFIKLGLYETSLIVSSIVAITFLIIKNSIKLTTFLKNNLVFAGFFLSTLIAILLVLPVMAPIFSLPILRSLQYPWRFLSVIQFTLPFIILYLFKLCLKKHLNAYLFGLVLLILIFRVPQLYGKNFVNNVESSYFFTQTNLHSSSLNTIWSGNTEDYPKKTTQLEVIEGKGIISNELLKNSSRRFSVISETDLRIVDYTFYFPGWNVKSNGQPVEIEFQDPEYRGLITYRLPKGEHLVEVVYRPTKIRLISRVISLISVFALIVLSVIGYKTSLLHKEGFTK